MMPNDNPQPAEAPSTALTKFDDRVLKGIQPSTGNSRAVFLPANFAEALEMAKILASGIGVRSFMRGNTSACMMIVQQSARWGMDPYAVASKAYFVNDQVAYEAQLINALINTSAEIIGRLKVEWEGDASKPKGQETMICRVRGRLRDDPDEEKAMEQELRLIKVRNSPLWETNPRMQLGYYTTRLWARLYAPEVLLGVYTPDEIVDGAVHQLEQQSTPRSDVKPPDRRQFQEPAAEEAEYAEISTVVVDESAAVPEPVDGHAEHSAVAAAEPGPEAASDDRPADDSAERPVSDEVARVWAADEERREAENNGTHILDTIPADPLERGAWVAAVSDAIRDLTTREAFDALRRRIAPALEKVEPDVLELVQDALTDKMMTLPENK